MKIIITENQLTTLVENRRINHELIDRIWNNDLGLEIVDFFEFNLSPEELKQICIKDDWVGLISLLTRHRRFDLLNRLEKIMDYLK